MRALSPPASGSIVIGTQRVLRFGPYPTHWIIFAQALRAPAFGGFVLICDVLRHLQGPARSRRRLSRCTAIAQDVSQELFA